MKVKEISPMKIVMGVSIGVAIIYSLKLGYIEVATAGLGIFGGYLAKDLETSNDEEEA